jgi:chromosome segregation protein
VILKSLNLQGFKSFGKKTELIFDAPITCVVGPNGSGKSNVVEALRFVLGEQSLKSMRGRSGSDFIFKSPTSGSNSSRAYVEVVFDNKARRFAVSREDGPALPIDFNEVRVSREVYPDGQSTYKINGAEVRLKDVIDILSSVHIGTSSYHVISQGSADKFLTVSSRERRAMVEDALGLRTYEIKLRESFIRKDSRAFERS